MNLLKEGFPWMEIILIWAVFFLLRQEYLKAAKNIIDFKGKKMRPIATGNIVRKLHLINFQQKTIKPITIVNRVGYVKPAWKLHFCYILLCIIMVATTIFKFFMYLNAPALSQILQ